MAHFLGLWSALTQWLDEVGDDLMPALNASPLVENTNVPDTAGYVNVEHDHPATTYLPITPTRSAPLTRLDSAICLPDKCKSSSKGRDDDCIKADGAPRGPLASDLLACLAGGNLNDSFLQAGHRGSTTILSTQVEEHSPTVEPQNAHSSGHNFDEETTLSPDGALNQYMKCQPASAPPPDLHPESTPTERHEDTWNREFDNALTEAYNALCIFPTFQHSPQTPVSRQIRTLLDRIPRGYRREWLRQLFDIGLRSHVLEIACDPESFEQREDSDLAVTSSEQELDGGPADYGFTGAIAPLRETNIGALMKETSVPFGYGEVKEVRSSSSSSSRVAKRDHREEPGALSLLSEAARPTFPSRTSTSLDPFLSTAIVGLMRMIRAESRFNERLRRGRLSPSVTVKGGNEVEARAEHLGNIVEQDIEEDTEEGLGAHGNEQLGCRPWDSMDNSPKDGGVPVSPYSSTSSRNQSRSSSNDSVHSASSTSTRSSLSATSTSSASSGKDHEGPSAFGLDGASRYWTPRSIKSTASVGLDPEKVFKGGSLKGFHDLKNSLRMTPIAKSGETAAQAIQRVSQLKAPVRPKPAELAGAKSGPELAVARGFGSTSARASQTNHIEAGSHQRQEKFTNTNRSNDSVLLPPQPQSVQAGSQSIKDPIAIGEEEELFVRAAQPHSPMDPPRKDSGSQHVRSSHQGVERDEESSDTEIIGSNPAMAKVDALLRKMNAKTNAKVDAKLDAMKNLNPVKLNATKARLAKRAAKASARTNSNTKTRPKHTADADAGKEKVQQRLDQEVVYPARAQLTNTNSPTKKNKGLPPLPKQTRATLQLGRAALGGGEDAEEMSDNSFIQNYAANINNAGNCGLLWDGAFSIQVPEGPQRPMSTMGMSEFDRILDDMQNDKHYNVSPMTDYNRHRDQAMMREMLGTSEDRENKFKRQVEQDGGYLVRAPGGGLTRLTEEAQGMGMGMGGLAMPQSPQRQAQEERAKQERFEAGLKQRADACPRLHARTYQTGQAGPSSSLSKVDWTVPSWKQFGKRSDSTSTSKTEFGPGEDSRQQRRQLDQTVHTQAQAKAHTQAQTQTQSGQAVQYYQPPAALSPPGQYQQLQYPAAHYQLPQQYQQPPYPSVLFPQPQQYPQYQSAQLQHQYPIAPQLPGPSSTSQLSFDSQTASRARGLGISCDPDLALDGNESAIEKDDSGASGEVESTFGQLHPRYPSQ
ncbi:Hypothetical predicted protein [Lecanosticta acicola]|uniref:Uncharacterized protein n=1 Tax=Lecanosticta acicola TaxID=111012 RepID=A0AAI8Z5L2_9PEZI|nr:Hypothetical predicted protein [Lecanosticta acicola]